MKKMLMVVVNADKHLGVIKVGKKMNKKWGVNTFKASLATPWPLLILLLSLLSQSITGCATTDCKTAVFKNFWQEELVEKWEPVWISLKAFWSDYDNTPPPLSGWDFEQLALVKGSELSVSIMNISFTSDRPQQWRFLLIKMEELEEVAVSLENHPYPSDPAQQETLDRISRYISQLRIAGGLAEEALRHADEELLAEAKKRVEKAKSFYP